MSYENIASISRWNLDVKTCSWIYFSLYRRISRVLHMLPPTLLFNTAKRSPACVVLNLCLRSHNNRRVVPATGWSSRTHRNSPARVYWFGSALHRTLARAAPPLYNLQTLTGMMDSHHPPYVTGTNYVWIYCQMNCRNKNYHNRQKDR
jgi:hypothetical protein